MTAKQRYRSKMRICYDMLRVIQEEGGEAGPTRILYGANLSYERLKRYLAELKDKGLIEEMQMDGKTVYRLTDSGRMFIAQFRKMMEFAKAFGMIL